MTLAKRYFLLISLSLLIALFAGAAAVRLVTDPILTAFQDDALEEQSRSISLLVENILDVHVNELEILARDSRIVSTVIGEIDHISRAVDHASIFVEAIDFQRIIVVDILEEALIDVVKDGYDIGGPAAQRPLLFARGMLAGNLNKPQIVHSQSGELNKFLIAVPVYLSGSGEGVVVGEYDTSIVIGTEGANLAERIALVRNNIADRRRLTNWVYSPIGETGLSVAVEPAGDRLKSAKNEIVLTVILAVFGALLVPFAVLAYGGRRAIMQPTQRLQKSEKELRDSQKKLSEFKELVETANGAVIVTDLHGQILWVNPAFSNLTGYLLDEIVGDRPGKFLQGPDTDPDTVREISTVIMWGQTIKTTILNYRKDRTPYWIELNISPMLDENGAIDKFFAISRDITEQLDRERQLLETHEAIEYQALHDPLTGLPNRRYIDKCFQDPAYDGALVVRVDLDHFKHVNDTLGHAAGDHVLVYVSEVISEKMGPDDIAARVGGDEFIMLLKAGTTFEKAQALCQSILDDLRQDIVYGDKRCRIGASFGIASPDDDLLDEKDIVSCADVALYLAKDRGRNTIVHYTKSVHADVMEMRTLASDLETALEDRSFVPYFQPQFCARREKMNGVEVLLRWDHPRVGILPPDKFLHVASQMSLLGKIEAILFEETVSILKDFESRGIKIPKASFNVSRDRLLDRTLPETLSGTGLKDTVISLEILESFLIEEENRAFFDGLSKIRDAGIQLELDDFGSGHASVIGLSQLRPDMMKIDRRLVQPILEDETTAKLLQSIIDIGRNLGIKIVAEGVETAAHARVLTDLGCDVLQGFYFSKPLAADAFESYYQRVHSAGSEQIVPISVPRWQRSSSC